MDDTLYGPALIASMRVLTRSTRGAFLELGPNGVGSMSMTTPFALFNGVVTTSLSPQAREIDLWAERFRGFALPWSIQLRGEPAPDVVEVAASYGLTARHSEPLMGMTLTGQAAVDQGPSVQATPVRHTASAALHGGTALVSRVGGSAATQYLSALADGSEAPPEALAVLASEALLSDPAVAAYLALAHEEPVATGMTTLADGMLGVLNMSTVPAQRRRGHARAVLVEMLAAGVRSGARAAVLQASDAAQHLYESVGFRTVETWTYLLAPDGTDDAAPLANGVRRPEG